MPSIRVAAETVDESIEPLAGAAANGLESNLSGA